METPMGGAPKTVLSLDLVVPNNTRYLRLIGNIAEQLAKVADTVAADHDTIAYHLNLALTEAAANAIRHGPPSGSKNAVRICISIEDKDLCAQVHDHGQGFNLEAVPTPDFADLDEHGRGLFLIRSVMDSLEYRKTESGNVLEMRKRLA